MNKLTSFFKPLSYRGVVIEYASGKKQDLKQMDYNVKSIDDSIVITADLSEYFAKITYQKTSEKVIKVKSVLTPKTNDIKDKVRKLTTLKVFGVYSESALLVRQNFIESKIAERSNHEKTAISEDFISIYEKTNVDSAVTFISNVNAKFYSNVNFKQSKTGVLFGIETVIPYSFEGEIIGEEWTVYLKTPTVTALQDNVKDYPISNEFENPVGWSTWDYYATSATEDDVIKNVDFIANNAELKDKIKYIAIDDGWEQREGDWVSGMRYPNGLKHTVDYIKSKG